MISTELSLEVSNSSNQKVMRLYDTSHYYNNQLVENYLIEVLPVNKSTWLTFHVSKNFSLVLNASSLQYKKVSKAADLIDLPDGIYEIKQSIKPNILTFNHFYHLRTTELMNTLSKEKDKLFDNICKLSANEYHANREKLRDIEEYIQGAKWKIEECGDKSKGKEMYEFAKTLLNQYSNECRC